MYKYQGDNSAENTESSEAAGSKPGGDGKRK
jgi:hypothetical protein